MSMKNKNKKIYRDHRIHLRVTADEYNLLKEASKIYNKKITTILMESIFSKLPQKILMSTPDLLILMAEVKKIGNNINQVARKINMGDIPQSRYVDEAIREIRKIITYLETHNGLR